MPAVALSPAPTISTGPRHGIARAPGSPRLGLGDDDAALADGAIERAAGQAGEVARRRGRHRRRRRRRSPQRRQAFVHVRLERAAAELARCRRDCR